MSEHGPYKVLVVDDEPEVASAIADALSHSVYNGGRLQFEGHAIYDPSQMDSVCASFRPDAFVFDIDFTKIDNSPAAPNVGLDLLEQVVQYRDSLRLQPYDLPVVIISGRLWGSGERRKEVLDRVKAWGAFYVDKTANFGGAQDIISALEARLTGGSWPAQDPGLNRSAGAP